MSHSSVSVSLRPPARIPLAATAALTLLLCVCGVIAAPAVSDSCAPEWGQPGFSSQKTSQSPLLGPSSASVKQVWTSTALGPVVIGGDGTVYTVGTVKNASSFSYGLTAISSSTGQITWQATVPTLPDFLQYSALVIGPHGTVYLGLGGTANNNPGTVTAFRCGSSALVWSSTLPSGLGSLLVGPHDTIFASSGGVTDLYSDLYALDGRTGNISWIVNNLTAVAVGPTGIVYGITNDRKNITALSADGTLLWSVVPVGQVTSASIDQNGTVYVASPSGGLQAYNSTGSLLWAVTPGAGAFKQVAAVTSLSTVLVSNANAICAVNTTGGAGVPTWCFSQRNRYFTPNVAVGMDATVYALSTVGDIYAVNGTSGGLLWTMRTTYNVAKITAIGLDKTLYLSPWNVLVAIQ